MSKSFSEKDIKKALIKALGERNDYSDYDYEDNFIPDESYYGWRDAIEFIREELGIVITEEDFDNLLEDNND